MLLGDGVRVGDHATVGPFAALHANVSVGHDAVVTHSIVLENVKIDPETKVARSVLSRKGSVDVNDDKDGD